MLITIDPASAEPIYRQIAGQIVTQIESGDITAGERLPPAADLAASLELNRNTVLQAYRQLRDAGWLELRRGRGAIARLPEHGQPPDNSSAMTGSIRQSALDAIAHLARTHGIGAEEIHRYLLGKDSPS